MIKIICLIVLCVAFVLLARGVRDYYAKRKNFSLDMLNLIKTISSEISFLKKDIKLICTNNSFGLADEMINQYYRDNKVCINYLSAHENQLLLDFMNSLGKQNVQGELGNLEYYKLKFEKFSSECESKYNTHGVLIYKLIMLAGLLLCIVFI